jgi:cyclopropane fatty-acyl-phospholipid synthase-like methyltransferase
VHDPDKARCISSAFVWRYGPNSSRLLALGSVGYSPRVCLAGKLRKRQYLRRFTSHLENPRLNSDERKMKNISHINEFYDRRMFEPFELKWRGSDFYNYRVFEKGLKTYQEACENLMERLLSFIPQKRGNILDVACGKGASSRHLLRCYADVTGINISERQLEKCRVVAPNVKFIQMNATALNFDNESFDDVICVEAAFHFETRARFLRKLFASVRAFLQAQ